MRDEQLQTEDEVQSHLLQERSPRLPQLSWGISTKTESWINIQNILNILLSIYSIAQYTAVEDLNIIFGLIMER